MKAMKKAMKKTIRSFKNKAFAKRLVFTGRFVKTASGLAKNDLIKSKTGKIVSKKKSLLGKKSKWIVAVTKARTALKIKGFHVIGGKTTADKALLAKARSFY